MKLELLSLAHAVLLSFAPSDDHRTRRTGSRVPRDVLQPSFDRRAPVDLVPLPAASQPSASGDRPKGLTSAVQPRRSKPPPGPPLPARTAAKRFVAWMQEHDFVGEYPWTGHRKSRFRPVTGIWDFYLWHCDEINVQPVPDNMFGDALGSVIRRRQVRDRSTGKLRRITHYMIPPLPEVVEQPRRERVKRAA